MFFKENIMKILKVVFQSIGLLALTTLEVVAQEKNLKENDNQIHFSNEMIYVAKETSFKKSCKDTYGSKWEGDIIYTHIYVYDNKGNVIPESITQKGYCVYIDHIKIIPPPTPAPPYPQPPVDYPVRYPYPTQIHNSIEEQKPAPYIKPTPVPK